MTRSRAAPRWSRADRRQIKIPSNSTGTRPVTDSTVSMIDQVARAIRLRDEAEAVAESAMRAIIDEAAAAVSDEFSADVDLKPPSG
jgi:hypothetical protein